jgi:hypothetical protein
MRPGQAKVTKIGALSAKQASLLVFLRQKAEIHGPLNVKRDVTAHEAQDFDLKPRTIDF